VTVTPARDATADVIMPSPRPSESSLRSDHRQNIPIAATTPAIITGISSRRSSSAGIVSFFIRFTRMSLPDFVFTGIDFEIVNNNRLNLFACRSYATIPFAISRAIRTVQSFNAILRRLVAHCVGPENPQADLAIGMALSTGPPALAMAIIYLCWPARDRLARQPQINSHRCKGPAARGPSSVAGTDSTLSILEAVFPINDQWINVRK
jgi:hypothetical protein